MFLETSSKKALSNGVQMHISTPTEDRCSQALSPNSCPWVSPGQLEPDASGLPTCETQLRTTLLPSHSLAVVAQSQEEQPTEGRHPLLAHLVRSSPLVVSGHSLWPGTRNGSWSPALRKEEIAQRDRRKLNQSGVPAGPREHWELGACLMPV